MDVDGEKQTQTQAPKLTGLSGRKDGGVRKKGGRGKPRNAIRFPAPPGKRGAEKGGRKGRRA